MAPARRSRAGGQAVEVALVAPPVTLATSSPFVASAMTWSAAPSSPPRSRPGRPRRAVTSVPDTSWTETSSAPPKVLAVIDSTSFRSMVMFATSRVKRIAPAVRGRVHALVRVAAVEGQRVGAGLALDHVARRRRDPTGTCRRPAPRSRCRRAWLPSATSLPSPPSRRSAPLPPSSVSFAGAAVDGQLDQRGQVPGRGEAGRRRRWRSGRGSRRCRCRWRTAPG